MRLLFWIRYCGCLLALGLLCACSHNRDTLTDTVKVTLLDSQAFHLAPEESGQILVRQGEEARFVIYPNTGYVITGADYPGAVVTGGKGDSLVLILKDINYPTNVKVTTESDKNIKTIIYDANRGHLPDGRTTYSVKHILNGHLYPNTDNGSSLYKEGATLTGWNTKPDGTGTEIGLGSRCYEDGEITLYAMWQDFGSEDQFVFLETHGGYSVKSYLGSDKTVAVPESHNGKTVTAIEKGAFINKDIDKLILPKKLERLEQGAFCKCHLGKLYFYDNISFISDASFTDTPLPQVHILAKEPPRYAGSGRASNYADKVDLLFLHENDKKIVIFGGSGTYYSVLASRMQQLLNDEYKVINMGMNGWFPAFAQMDVIRKYMHQGDILLHIPEMASSTQLGADTGFSLFVEDKGAYDDRYLRSLELNYDLISLMDLNATTGFFDSFCRFNSARQSQPATNYSDYSHYINENGDFPNRKLSYQKNEAITHEADICTRFLTEDSFNRLNAAYSMFDEKNVEVMVAFAAVNENALMEVPEYMERAKQFEELMRENLKVPVLGSIYEAFYPGGIFYNSDWHLSEEGDIQNTERITNELLKTLESKDQQQKGF